MRPPSLPARRTEARGAAHDASGNLTAWTGNAYEYDRLSMLTRRTAGAEDWVFVYTADDERLWSYRTAAGGHVVTLRDLDGRVLRRHDVHVGGWGAFTDLVYRGNDLLASVDAAGAVTHVHNDHFGTPRILSDQAGQTARYYAYYPFGEELFPALDTQPMRFTGHERDLLATAETADEDASFATKATAVSLLVAGVVGPGGGLSGRADDIVAAGERLAQDYVRGGVPFNLVVGSRTTTISGARAQSLGERGGSLRVIRPPFHCTISWSA